MINSNLSEGDGEDLNLRSNPDILASVDGGGEIHPSPEITLLRLAIDKALMRSQRELWYMYAYDKLNYTEIAKKLKVSKQSVQQRIKTIERQLTKYCKEHLASYNAIKEAENE